jgi:hypothetical protein
MFNLPALEAFTTQIGSLIWPEFWPKLDELKYFNGLVQTVAKAFAIILHECSEVKGIKKALTISPVLVTYLILDLPEEQAPHPNGLV